MTDIPTVNLNEYNLADPSAAKRGQEVFIILISGATVYGKVESTFTDGPKVAGLGVIKATAIERYWVKRPPCPHNTLRRQYEGSRALIYFICADDATPWCHQQFTADPFGDPTTPPKDN